MFKSGKWLVFPNAFVKKEAVIAATKLESGKTKVIMKNGESIEVTESAEEILMEINRFSETEKEDTN